MVKVLIDLGDSSGVESDGWKEDNGMQRKKEYILPMNSLPVEGQSRRDARANDVKQALPFSFTKVQGNCVSVDKT